MFHLHRLLKKNMTIACYPGYLHLYLQNNFQFIWSFRVCMFSLSEIFHNGFLTKQLTEFERLFYVSLSIWVSVNSNVPFTLDDLCHFSNDYLYWTTGVVLSIWSVHVRMFWKINHVFNPSQKLTAALSDFLLLLCVLNKRCIKNMPPGGHYFQQHHSTWRQWNCIKSL